MFAETQATNFEELGSISKNCEGDKVVHSTQDHVDTFLALKGVQTILEICYFLFHQIYLKAKTNNFDPSHARLITAMMGTPFWPEITRKTHVFTCHLFRCSNHNMVRTPAKVTAPQSR
jgi:hypothetical protein